MTTKIEPVGATIDKLTLLCDLKVNYDEFYKKLEKLGFELQDYKSRKYGYTYVYIHSENAGYIEMAAEKIPYDAVELQRRRNRIWGYLMDINKGEANRSGMTIEELHEKLEDIQELLSQMDERGHIRRLKDVRYEFNPKYLSVGEETKSIYREVVSMLNLDTIGLSSIHIALDYNININSLVITDTRSRKENRFYGVDKFLETMYLGKRASRNHLCIYDKKKENDDNESMDQYPDLEHVVRFEARLKNNYAKDFITTDFNPFKGVKVAINSLKAVTSNQDWKIKDRAMIFYLLSNPEEIHSMPPTTKKRWVERINELVELSLDVVEDYEQKKDSLVDELGSLLNLSK